MERVALGYAHGLLKSLGGKRRVVSTITEWLADQKDLGVDEFSDKPN